MADNLESIIIEGNYLFRKGKYKEALLLYLECYEKGELTCMTRIGWIYGKGLGVKKNLEEATKWFNKAVKYGDVEAVIALGRIALTNNHDCDAFESFKKASKLRFAPGMYWMGKCYSYGYCVTKNNKKAFIYYTFSARKGHFLARRERAKMLMQGKSGPFVFSFLVGAFEFLILFIDMTKAINKNPNDPRFFA